MPHVKTLPGSEQLAAAVPPLQKLYIEAVIAEATRPLLALIEQLKAENDGLKQRIATDLATFNARLDSYDTQRQRDDKYVLSREKIIRFMKAKGID